MRISIVGSGYVGLITGISFASFGHNVIFIDVDPDKIDFINSGKSPIYEEGLDELMLKTKHNYYATSNYSEAIKESEITFICVGTPSNEDGSMNYTFIENASSSIGEALKNEIDRHTIIVKSTVLPGTTESLVKENLEKGSGKKAFLDFGLGMNPEFLREGRALHDFLNPDRIILGIEDEETNKMLRELYSVFNSKQTITSIKEAEMIKYVSNAFLATKISFSNEIGNICKKLNIDSWKIFEAVGLDTRISPAFFKSGIGYGGSCFPKDIKALQFFSITINEPTPILDATESVNNSQPLKLVQLMKKYVADLSDVKIGILGLSFKPETDDVRESRAIPIIEVLKEKFDLYLYDPMAMENFSKLYPSLFYMETADKVIELCDVILIITEWTEFNLLDYSGKIVIDGRRIKSAIETASVYEGVCW